MSFSSLSLHRTWPNHFALVLKVHFTKVVFPVLPVTIIWYAIYPAYFLHPLLYPHFPSLQLFCVVFSYYFSLHHMICVQLFALLLHLWWTRCMLRILLCSAVLEHDLAIDSAICPSVCLSVCLPQAGNMWKQMLIGLLDFHSRVAERP